MLPFEPVAVAVGGGIAGAPFFTGPFVRIILHVSIYQTPISDLFHFMHSTQQTHQYGLPSRSSTPALCTVGRPQSLHRS